MDGARIQPKHAMQIPTLALHELKGERKNTWTVTVQTNWRITFRFENGDAEIVDYEDYHSVKS